MKFSFLNCVSHPLAASSICDVFDIGDNGKKFEKMNTIRVILGLISSRLSLFKLTGGHETELLLIFSGYICQMLASSHKFG